MAGRNLVGAVLLGALAVSSSGDLPLERIIELTPAQQAHFAMKAAVCDLLQNQDNQSQFSDKHERNRQRLLELSRELPSDNMEAVYVNDFDELIWDTESKRESEIRTNFKKPDYWENHIKNFDAVSVDYYTYFSTGIRTPEELRKIVSDPKKRKKLEEMVVDFEKSIVRSNWILTDYALRPEPLALPVILFGHMVPRLDDMTKIKVPFYFSTLSFAGTGYLDEKSSLYPYGRWVNVSPQINSLVNYVYAAVYAQQLAFSFNVKISSAAELKALRERDEIIGSHSALEETRLYFMNMCGSQNPATHFVDRILKNFDKRVQEQKSAVQ